MRKLNVFYKQKLVGVLAQDEQLVYSFTYDQSWLTDPECFQLSLAMPLQAEPFGNKVTLSFFENLLPEAEARDALEKSHEATGTFGLLEKFGKDCAGAVIVTSESTSPFIKEQGQQMMIEMDQIYQALEERRSVAEVVAGLDPGYLSIAGAQDKFSAIYKEQKLYLPAVGNPTTHIIKVPIYRSGVKGSVYNEYFCMQLAKRVGINVPHCKVLDHNKYPLYIIERYDRSGGEIVSRLHQQDFCQAQGVVSENKYEIKGGPTIQDNYELIKKNVVISKRTKALFDYLDWIAFNLLIGNNDSHSKNISFLLKDGKIELAPFYDLLCTAIYPKLKKNFSFFIGQRDDMSTIGKNQFDQLDKQLGLKVGTMSARMVSMSESLLEKKENVIKEVLEQFSGAKIILQISQLIEKRCKSLKRQGL